MKKVTRSSKIANVHYDIRGPLMQKAAEMEMEGAEIIKLNIGNPAPHGLSAPDEIMVDMIYNLRSTQGYSDSKGLFAARKAIMQYCQLKNIPNVGVEDIFTGNGVSELIVTSMQALLENGDEILVPSPDYPLWTAAVVMSGGRAVHYVCDEQNEWNPDPEDIEKKITPRTRGIVVINPNNPTGMLYSDEILRSITEIARRHGLIIFADEIYDRLLMDNRKHTAIASFAPDLLTLCFNGLSKSHRVAGFRSGWMCVAGNKKDARDYIDGLYLLASLRLCSNVPGQSIIQTALGGYQSSDDLLKPGGRIYEQREYITSALQAIPGITVQKPMAAFYIFPKIDLMRYGFESDEQFASELLRQKKVLVNPGTGFASFTPDHFRIVYLPDIIVLKEAMTRISDFLEKHEK